MATPSKPPTAADTDLGRMAGEALHPAPSADGDQGHPAPLGVDDARVRELLAISHDCVKVLDLDGKLIAMGERGQKLLGIEDLTQYLRTCWADWWHGTDHAQAAAAVALARAGGVARFQAFATTPGGVAKWWDIVVCPILGPDGQPERLLSVSKDITGERAAPADPTAATAGAPVKLA